MLKSVEVHDPAPAKDLSKKGEPTAKSHENINLTPKIETDKK